MSRNFTFTLKSLLAQHVKRPNYLCFSVADLAALHFSNNPIMSECGRYRLSEYPNSAALIKKFRELVPHLFIDIREVEPGNRKVIEGHMTKEVRMKIVGNDRRHVLEESIKLYGEDFELTMELNPKF
jgi:hypothetical protein